MMRLLIATGLVLIMATTMLPAQSPDTWGSPARVADPISNRLFAMPTGTIVEPRRLRVGVMAPIGVHGTYAPSTFMQVSLSGFYSPFPAFYSYVSGGVKIQVLEPSDWFRGLAANADFGLLYGRGEQTYRGSILSYGLATSLGTDAATLHLAATSLPYGTTDTATMKVKYVLQAGASVPIWVDGQRGFKAIGEFSAGGQGTKDIHSLFAAVGVRGYMKRWSWEVGLAMGPKSVGERGDMGTELYKSPYFSVTFMP